MPGDEPPTGSSDAAGDPDDVAGDSGGAASDPSTAATDPDDVAAGDSGDAACPSDGGQSESDDLAPIEVFDLVADETRLDIVRALAALSSEQWSGGTVSYSELRHAVGVEDGGRFNYHLRKLRGPILSQDGDRYRLTGVGYRVARVLGSGRFRHGASRTWTSDSTCLHCDRRLTGIFEDGVLSLRCDEHGVVTDMILPPATAERHEPAAIERYAALRSRWYVELARYGGCYECWGAVDTSISDPGDEPPVEPTGPLVEVSCSRCELTYWLPPAVYLQAHPAVVAQFWEHDPDLGGTPMPDLDAFCEANLAVERTADGVRVRFEPGADSLVLELDREANVVAVRREDGDA